MKFILNSMRSLDYTYSNVPYVAQQWCGEEYPEKWSLQQNFRWVVINILYVH